MCPAGGPQPRGRHMNVSALQALSHFRNLKSVLAREFFIGKRGKSEDVSSRLWLTWQVTFCGFVHSLAPPQGVTPSVSDSQSSSLTRRLQNTCNLSIEIHNLSRPRWRPLQAARCAGTHVNGHCPKDLASLMFEVWRLIFMHRPARRQVHGLYWNDVPKT